MKFNYSFCHADNRKKKVILVLREILTDRLDDTTITAEPKCHVILLNQERKIARVCITMESKKKKMYAISVNVYQFKAKDSQIKPNLLCLGNISKGFIVNIMENWVKWVRV